MLEVVLDGVVAGWGGGGGLTWKDNRRTVPPPPHTHTHTHTRWVLVSLWSWVTGKLSVCQHLFLFLVFFHCLPVIIFLFFWCDERRFSVNCVAAVFLSSFVYLCLLLFLCCYIMFWSLQLTIYNVHKAQSNRCPQKSAEHYFISLWYSVHVYRYIPIYIPWAIAGIMMYMDKAIPVRKSHMSIPLCQ